MPGNEKEQLHHSDLGHRLKNSPIIEALVSGQYVSSTEEIDTTMQKLISWKNSYLGNMDLQSPLEYESLLELSGFNPYYYEEYYLGDKAQLEEVDGERLMRTYYLLQVTINEASARAFELMICDMPRLGAKDIILAVKKFTEDG